MTLKINLLSKNEKLLRIKKSKYVLRLRHTKEYTNLPIEK